ncbi:Uncharacterised protein [Candidatus Bartonella washoeensis]|uniref:Uncharacterized protein n=1 Tax=Candidatus Bartonella washoeensis Sb944nv TaxID=1094563 RepID=J0Q5C1_9HYPH|nr:hypothetical protein [Bartonella washoeensis]EJF77809.1 hypothetical protein MCQ_01467 [Bartonella washoeensis Sb944nv]EJF77824.1 hypothetical protein MCQ_01462 [Bartonella washoeensis Sb944nv]SPU27859.1 Uncharacterised protein [Bartonella washoeensis]
MILWLKKYQMMLTAALAVFFIALVKAFHLGKKSEQHKQTENALKITTTRLEVENEVNRKSDGDVRSALSRWVRGK